MVASVVSSCATASKSILTSWVFKMARRRARSASPAESQSLLRSRVRSLVPFQFMPGIVGLLKVWCGR